MIEHNVFVKKLDIIESLGACSLICTDKTGTLTMNKMSVSNSWSMNSFSRKDGVMMPPFIPVSKKNAPTPLEEQDDSQLKIWSSAQLRPLMDCATLVT
jgi:magnesium-transporting ATPase (P-type)